jgi:hypothetical protein
VHDSFSTSLLPRRRMQKCASESLSRLLSSELFLFSLFSVELSSIIEWHRHPPHPPKNPNLYIYVSIYIHMSRGCFIDKTFLLFWRTTTLNLAVFKLTPKLRRHYQTIPPRENVWSCCYDLCISTVLYLHTRYPYLYACTLSKLTFYHFKADWTISR